MSHLIGIDQGTSGTTVVALDGELSVVARSSRAVRSTKAEPGHVEQDPWHVLETVVDATGDTLSQVDSAAIAAGVAHQGETVLAWHRDTGAPLSEAIVWSDRRASALVERLRRTGLAPLIESRSHLKLDPYFCAAKYAWLLETRPDLADLGEKLALTTLETWLIAQLGAAESTDTGTASRTQLTELGADSWDPDLLAWFDIDESFLSPIQPSFSDRGHVTRPQSWDVSLRLSSSVVDQPAALFGNGCLEAGDLKVTYGTGAFLVANVGRHRPGPVSTMVPSVGWSDSVGPVFVVDGGVLSAGSALAWLEQLGVDTSPQAHARVEGLDGHVLVLPAFDGLGAPHWDRDATAIIAGMTSATTADDLLRGFLDAIAFRVAEIVEAYTEAGFTSPESIRVDGGLSRSRYLMQRQADLLGIPVTIGPEPEATAVGAALMAGVAIGQLTLDDVRTATAPTRTVDPVDQGRAREDYLEWIAFARSAGHREAPEE